MRFCNLQRNICHIYEYSYRNCFENTIYEKSPLAKFWRHLYEYSYLSCFRITCMYPLGEHKIEYRAEDAAHKDGVPCRFIATVGGRWLSVHSFACTFCCSIDRYFHNSFRSFVFIRLFVLSFIRSFVRSFVRSCIHSYVKWVLCVSVITCSSIPWSRKMKGISCPQGRRTGYISTLGEDIWRSSADS